MQSSLLPKTTTKKVEGGRQSPILSWDMKFALKVHDREADASRALGVLHSGGCTCSCTIIKMSESQVAGGEDPILVQPGHTKKL